MRNLRRLYLEIKILEQVFGYRNISYPLDGSWVKIFYSLPQHKVIYNLAVISLLIIVPQDYDPVSASECYIDRDLMVKEGKEFRCLPHTHYRKYEEQGYQWICIHASSKFVSLLDLINVLKLYFTDPFQYDKLQRWI